MNRYFLKRKKLGEILVEQNRLTPEELNEILRIQKENPRPMGQILVEREILTEEELSFYLGEQLGIPHVWLRKGLVDPKIVQVLPKEKALFFQVLPMFSINGVLTLATADPHAIFVFDEISRLTGLEIQPVLCRTDDILDAIHECYMQEVNIDEVMSNIDGSNIEFVQDAPERDINELAEMAQGSPVISLSNTILLKAIRDGGSDIHIEPQLGKFRVRVRIDGILYDQMSPRIELHSAVVSRLKVMANLDISERRMPQDGRIQVKVDGRVVDLRFSSMPGIRGEKVVLRILDKSKALLDINTLGLDAEMLLRYKLLLRRPYGLLLVCGPTGSGKTTSLYSAITMLNSDERNIITIEDPVEYQLEGINQNQVKGSIGLDFPKFLKHALRQDPDIIMVGEIRDRETAEIAIQACLTGHLVLSTLHTNDSPSSITRLLDMGIEPYLISSSLTASMAQRLVRAICPECKTYYYPPKEVLEELGVEGSRNIQLSKGKGCSACYDSGYRGRLGIFEILEVEEDLQSLILQHPSLDVLKGHLRKNGHAALKELGYRRVLEGVTTLEEVKRVSSIEN
jgi:type IV pilus assembly protein PilB